MGSNHYIVDKSKNEMMEIGKWLGQLNLDKPILPQVEYWCGGFQGDFIEISNKISKFIKGRQVEIIYEEDISVPEPILIDSIMKSKE